MKCQLCGESFSSTRGALICQRCFQAGSAVRTQEVGESGATQAPDVAVPGFSGRKSGVQTALQATATVVLPILVLYQILGTAGAFFMLSGFGSAIGHSGPGWVDRALPWVILIIVAGVGLAVLTAARLERTTFESPAFVPPPWWSRTRSRVVTTITAVGSLLLVIVNAGR